ncbi:uncharacterized protein LOC120195170 [Hibiscus syriacus]|uniref:uncharacterized protein LOC120195170 n=1 Tax=Hibiscus syriacus TaxID=106335 RepID=UPI001924E562|nr:uncharacterized protein LOC120195170 [Hibiscus syriacus]
MVAGSTENRKRDNFIADLDVDLREGDVKIGMKGTIPSICFSERVHDSIDEKLSKSIIVRLLGKKICYNALLNRIQILWRTAGEIQLVDLDNYYFIVRFVLENDYFSVCLEVLDGVRFPYKYYTKSLFRVIAGALGKIVKIDYNTTEGKHGRFVRLAIVVNLERPLIPGIRIDGRYQVVEYEGLPTICYQCGKYGYVKEFCNGGSDRASTAITKVANESITPEEPYGPWKQVASRKQKTIAGKKNSTVSITVEDQGIGRGSRFETLASVEENIAQQNISQNKGGYRETVKGRKENGD